MQPVPPGGDTRRSRWACPRGQSGRNGRGMQPKGWPKRSAEICAPMNEKASLMARPMRTPTCTSLTVDGAARCRSPVLAHVLQDVLPIGWVPHGVACNHEVGSASGNHHARVHIARRRRRVHHGGIILRDGPECHGVKGDAASPSCTYTPRFSLHEQMIKGKNSFQTGYGQHIIEAREGCLVFLRDIERRCGDARR